MNTQAQVDAAITALATCAPGTWRTIVDATLPVADGELEALRSHPAAGVLLDGDRIRVVGLINAIFHATSSAIDGHMASLAARISELELPQ